MACIARERLNILPLSCNGISKREKTFAVTIASTKGLQNMLDTDEITQIVSVLCSIPETGFRAVFTRAER
jgi:hypothetical protein